MDMRIYTHCTHVKSWYHCLFDMTFLKKELRARRAALGLTAAAKALIICDDAEQHHHPTFLNLRNLWCLEQTAIIMGSDKDNAELNIPGGFGATGAPNDGGIHQFFHSLRKSYLRCAVGWTRNPLHASNPDDYEFGPDGEPVVKCCLEMSLSADAYAIQKIHNHRPAPLFVLWCCVYIPSERETDT